MLNADDPETVFAMRTLASVAAHGKRPIVFWVGAGASRWLGYPSWKDLCLQIRKKYYLVPGFDNRRAVELLNKQNYPAIFQMCRELDSGSYNRFIVDAFAPRTGRSVYRKFVELLEAITPLFVVTTNVDEALEKNLSSLTTVQKTDLRRCADLLHEKTPFVAKLHGSVSSVRSMVFTTGDYTELLADVNYLNSLKYIFTGCTVVFLTYGIRDQYVIKLLQEDASHMDLFGPGPHFAVTNDSVPVPSLRRIRYLIKANSDHSAALSVLAYLAQSAKPPTTMVAVGADAAFDEPKSVETQAVPPDKTAYYVTDLLPGDFQEITAAQEGTEIEGSFGLGFTVEELPFRGSTALHDVLVGLICFDYVYLPTSALALIYTLLGESLFSELLRQDVLRFVHDIARLGVLFRPKEVIGDIGQTTVRGKDNSGPRPVSEVVRLTFSPQKGKEAEAEKLFEEIERRTSVYRKADEIGLASLARGALIMPAVSRLLGIGNYILPTQVPRWLRYSYLRLGHLVQTAVLCAEYNIRAAKVSFGGIQLTSAAFGVQTTEISAEHLASYVAAGVFNADLGALVLQNPLILKQVLGFRSSTAAKQFRTEIRQALAMNDGYQFSASVNAGLARVIPIAILQQARDKLLTLMTENRRVAAVPAVWGNLLSSDLVTKRWRERSAKMLVDLCQGRGISKDDPCICGSEERLRLCCLAPLRR